MDFSKKRWIKTWAPAPRAWAQAWTWARPWAPYRAWAWAIFLTHKSKEKAGTKDGTRYFSILRIDKISHILPTTWSKRKITKLFYSFSSTKGEE